jgi:hypothetical protein
MKIETELFSALRKLSKETPIQKNAQKKRILIMNLKDQYGFNSHPQLHGMNLYILNKPPYSGDMLEWQMADTPGRTRCHRQKDQKSI